MLKYHDIIRASAVIAKGAVDAVLLQQVTLLAEPFLPTIPFHIPIFEELHVVWNLQPLSLKVLGPKYGILYTS